MRKFDNPTREIRQHIEEKLKGFVYFFNQKTSSFFLLSILFLTTLNTFAQLITENPTIEKKESGLPKLRKVTITDNHTQFSFSFYEKTLEEKVDEFLKTNKKVKEEIRRNPDLRDSYARQAYMYFAQSSNTISFSPNSYLLTKDNKKYRFIKCTNIPRQPDNIKTEHGKTYFFSVYFEKLDPGIEDIDLIEGYKKEGETLNYWNYYGIKINNPANENAINTPTLAAVPVNISLKGTLFDAKTKMPIVGNIRYESEGGNYRVSESTSTNNSGEFNFKLSPKAYNFTAVADGYETISESLDLSKISKNQQFTQNFFLNKVEKKEIEKPKKEETVLLPREVKPETSPIKVEENKFRLDRVYFPLGESTILPTSFDQLDGLVTMMKENPKMTILIEGHTDNVGDPTQNKRLSIERAFNVREYLVNKGIAGSRIQFKGYGDTKPIASNETDEGRQENRRVEFVIINK